MLELQRPDSLVVRVVSAIRAEIDSGQLAPESRLPTEQQLAEQLNVSRSVVREAIAQLKADGAHVMLLTGKVASPYPSKADSSYAVANLFTRAVQKAVITNHCFHAELTRLYL